MDLFSILLLGIVQGISEWLPLSSKTMDAFVFLNLLGGERAAVLPLVLWLHVGTLLAATLYFRRRIWSLGMEALSRRRAPRLLLEGNAGYLFAALAGTAAVGLPLLLLEKFVLPQLEASLLLALMGLGLLLTAVLLYTQRRAQDRPSSSADWRDGLLTGLLQGLSVLPGVSRAGATTSALVWRGFSSSAAFELSFLLSIPTVLCAELLLWLVQSGPSLPGALPLFDGLGLAASSFVFGYLSIDFLLRAARRINLWQLAALFGLLMLAAGLARLG